MSEKRLCDYCEEEIKEKIEGARGTYCSIECRDEMESDLICDECGEHSDSVQYYGGMIGASICSECADNVEYCEVCGNAVWYVNAYRRERDDEELIFCSEDCLDQYEGRHSSYVYSYCHKPTPIFYGSDKPNARYYGVECELDTEDGCPRMRAEEEIYDKFSNYVYMKYDGSLSEGGVEIVSHPMTLEYHRDTMQWEKLFDIARNSGLESREGAGFHIHVSNGSFKDVVKTQANLVRMFNKFWEEIVDFSGRDYWELDDWAGKPYIADLYANDNDIVSAIEEEGRYTAVNLQNASTTEIRVMASVDTFRDFMARLDFVDNAVEIADTMEWAEIESMNFRDILDWKEIKKEKVEKIEIKIA